MIKSRPALFLLAAWLMSASLPAAQVAAPPNGPAELKLENGIIQLRYNGALVFDGRLTNPEALRNAVSDVFRTGDAVSQVIVFNAKREPLQISGVVTASGEAFPCESDRAVRGRPVVRHSSGLSRSRLNQAVYDRKWDWVLSVDDQPHTAVRVTPRQEEEQSRAFGFEARGNEVVLRFRPRYYQKHRGLEFFQPWNHPAWTEPVVGWCSWFAFLSKITEEDIKRTADVLSEVLRPFGYEYLQIDDGYQRATGLPDLWLKPNEKFPSGLAALAAYIKDKGLKPGLWTNATFSQGDYAAEHREWFVLDPAGNPARGNWIDYVVDASVPAAIDSLVRPIYRGLRGMGWEYFKLDALRHLRYEGYNTYRDHLARKGINPDEALRKYVSAVREEIGNGLFLLACWGARPELAGIVDGCRLGTDGFSYAGLAQYNSFNNVVWRNDPDHIELSDAEAWRSTTVTSLTGSLFMLTDKPERYRTSFVEPARRAAPVLVTHPGQIYDVDPSRSAQLWQADSQVSGRDPKPFDAGLTPAAHLYLLEVNRPFESWAVLGRTGGEFESIGFDELGLDPAKSYVVFEFWQKRFQGSLTKELAPGPLPKPYNCQVFIIRQSLPHPQLLATSRHITGGGTDLIDLAWKEEEGVLSGRSRVVAGDPYEIYLTEPAGWHFSETRTEAGEVIPLERHGETVRTGFRCSASRDVSWSVHFTK